MMIPSSSFYVTLTSGANKNEFPENQAQRFKNRLFHPLILREPGWRVGLVSLTIPRVHHDIRWIYEEGKSLFEWTYGAMSSNGRLTEAALLGGSSPEDVKQAFSGNGVDMMKFFTNYHDRKRMEGIRRGEMLAASDGKKYYLEYQWEGEELLINNENVFKAGSIGRPIIRMSKKLALKMKWIVEKKEKLDLLIPIPVYVLGPNLVMSLYESTVPEVLDVVNADNKKVFWKVDGDYFQLSVFANWRFINLNEAFRSNWQVDDRLIYVNSDVVNSGIVGNQMEDLLRVVPYISSNERGTFHFEPEHIHYKALRKAFFEVIETQVNERDGKLADFGSGECTLTLHFKRDFLATT